METARTESHLSATNKMPAPNIAQKVAKMMNEKNEGVEPISESRWNLALWSSNTD